MIKEKFFNNYIKKYGNFNIFAKIYCSRNQIKYLTK